MVTFSVEGSMTCLAQEPVGVWVLRDVMDALRESPSSAVEPRWHHVCELQMLPPATVFTGVSSTPSETDHCSLIELPASFTWRQCHDSSLPASGSRSPGGVLGSSRRTPRS